MLTLFKIIAFLIAITIHEAAHAWMADRLGDPTAKMEKRVSLNPIRHMDLYGTVLVPLFLILVGSPFIFGWAKPVAFDPFNLKNPRKDAALISLAGPAANIACALFFSLLMHLFSDPFSQLILLMPLFYLIIAVNIVLAVFNLIPVHPLDGGKIIVGMLPIKDAREYDRFMHRWGTLILIFLIFPLFGKAAPVNYLLSPIMDFALKLLVPSAPFL